MSLDGEMISKHARLETVQQATHAMEQRQAPRVAARYAVELTISGLPGPLSGTTSDIGTGGLCIETSSPFDLSSLRQINISFGDGRLQCSAQGRWQRGNAGNSGISTGITFGELDTQKRAMLHRLVHQRSQELSTFLMHSELGALELDEALDLALCTRMSEFKAGQYIYRQGVDDSKSNSVYVVNSGAVLLEAEGRPGRRVLLDRADPGAVFAGMPLLFEYPHLESAVAESDTVLFEIDPFTFRYLERAKPNAARCVTRALMSKRARLLANLIERVAEMAGDMGGSFLRPLGTRAVEEERI
jgi:CRP-like cAMP-binding protein